MSKAVDVTPCPAFHGGPQFGKTVYYCVHDEGHEGDHRDMLGNEWERHDGQAQTRVAAS